MGAALPAWTAPSGRGSATLRCDFGSYFFSALFSRKKRAALL